MQGKSTGGIGPERLILAWTAFFGQDSLETEQDVGVQLALASALGKLGSTGAIDRLLALLRRQRIEYAVLAAR